MDVAFQKDFIYLLLGRGEEKEKERERNINVQEKYQSAASHRPPVRDLAQKPGV